MIRGIDVVYLHALKTEEIGIWYSEVLGLKIAFETSDQSWREFDFKESPSTRFAVEATDQQSSEIEKQHIMISFRVDDIKEFVKSLEEKGVEFYGSPKIKKEGFSLFATLQDPAGNWIQLSQRVED